MYTYTYESRVLHIYTNIRVQFSKAEVPSAERRVLYIHKYNRAQFYVYIYIYESRIVKGRNTSAELTSAESRVLCIYKYTHMRVQFYVYIYI